MHRALLFALVSASIGCSRIDRYLETNHCKSLTLARPSISNSGLVYGGDKAKMRASIDEVVAECVRIDGVTDSGTTRYGYKYPVTATINYAIQDTAFFNAAIRTSAFPAIVFEAISKKGVVLGRDDTMSRWIRGDTTTSASAAINLSPGEAKLLDRIEVRWLYGS